MIISASRRTDIPAFQGDWFMDRLAEGYCLVPNPFNRRQVSRILLGREDVDAIVFWSKNPRPMMSHLDELDRLGYRYYFLYTLNNYEPSMEPKVPPFGKRLQTFMDLSARLGRGRVVWRYDPIILSRKYTVEHHLRNFEDIACSLKGYASRVIISFVDFYKKTERRLSALEKETGDIFCRDIFQAPGLDVLVDGLLSCAAANGMEIQSCAEDSRFQKIGLRAGKCIDDRLLNELFGLKAAPAKDSGQRETCGCIQSRDIGVSNTCVHGCRYCYATS